MGDQEDAERGAAHGVDAVGDDAESVDVEAGVGFVHEGEFGFEHGHLEDFAALLFAAGEAVVDRAGSEFPVDLEEVHFRVEAFIIGGGVDFLALGHAGLLRGAEEIGDGDAGDFARILEGEEDAGAGALIGFLFEDRDAVDEDIAARDCVVWVAGDRFGERGFAGAVRPHNGVHFAAVNREGEALDDGLFADGDVEVLDD